MNKIIILASMFVLFLFLLNIAKPFGKKIFNNDFYSYQKEIIPQKEHNKKKQHKSEILYLKENLKNTDFELDKHQKTIILEEKNKNFNNSKKDYKQINQQKKEQDKIITKEFNKLVEETNNKIINRKYEEAIVGLTDIISYYPKYPNGYIARANIYFITQKYEEALEDYKKALSLGNKTAVLYLKLATTEYELELYKDSINNYLHALTLKYSNSEYIYYKLIGAYIFTESFDNALNNLNKYLEFPSKTINTNDYYKWENVLNKYKEDDTTRELKNNLKKLKFIKT